MHVDLLDPSTEVRYGAKPQSLLEDWSARKTQWVFIDEIQKQPNLLDVVHLGIEKHKIRFALTGSSARKLRRGAANLLGGRAFEFHLHPFTAVELGEKFDLTSALSFGTLPHLLELNSDQDRRRFLYSYASTYLREEILVEQIVRKIEPFRRFLEAAGQMNGKILNFAKIARDAGVEEKSVQRYYQILEDTLLGFFLDPFHRSIRKRQSQKAKFYFFDTGVTRALNNTLELPLTPRTSPYGELFEQFVINEMIRHNDYREKQFRFSYLRTKDDVEIDVVIEKPGGKLTLVEIKSKDRVVEEDVRSLVGLAKELGKVQCYVLSTSAIDSEISGVRCVHWQRGLEELFSGPE